MPVPSAPRRSPSGRAGPCSARSATAPTRSPPGQPRCRSLRTASTRAAPRAPTLRGGSSLSGCPAMRAPSRRWCGPRATAPRPTGGTPISSRGCWPWASSSSAPLPRRPWRRRGPTTGCTAGTSTWGGEGEGRQRRHRPRARRVLLGARPLRAGCRAAKPPSRTRGAAEARGAPRDQAMRSEAGPRHARPWTGGAPQPKRRDALAGTRISDLQSSVEPDTPWAPPRGRWP